MTVVIYYASDREKKNENNKKGKLDKKNIEAAARKDVIYNRRC